jgi:hypothetical protein
MVDHLVNHLVDHGSVGARRGGRASSLAGLGDTGMAGPRAGVRLRYRRATVGRSAVPIRVLHLTARRRVRLPGAVTAGLGGGLVLAFRSCGPGHMVVEHAGEAR